MNKNIKRIVFLVGWLLSPFSWWNDALINLPLSYLAASIFTVRFSDAFSILFIFFYWVSNILGIFLMHVTSCGSLKLNSKFKVLLAVLIYSLAIFLLAKQNIVRPIFLHR